MTRDKFEGARAHAAARSRRRRLATGPLARDLAFVAAFLAIVVVAGSVYGLAAGTRQKKLEREADRAQVAADSKAAPPTRA